MSLKSTHSILACHARSSLRRGSHRAGEGTYNPSPVWAAGASVIPILHGKERCEIKCPGPTLFQRIWGTAASQGHWQLSSKSVWLECWEGWDTSRRVPQHLPCSSTLKRKLRGRAKWHDATRMQLSKSVLRRCVSLSEC